MASGESEPQVMDGGAVSRDFQGRNQKSHGAGKASPSKAKAGQRRTKVIVGDGLPLPRTAIWIEVSR